MAVNGRVWSGTLKHSYFYVNWQDAGQSTSDNYTNINWQAGINCGNSNAWDAWYTNAMRIDYIYINGVKVLDSTTYSNVSGAGDHQLASNSLRVYHESDGTKTIRITIRGWLYSYGTTSEGGENFTLNTIPRYLNEYHNAVSSEGLNSVSIHWWCNPNTDYVQYSINGGRWIDIYNGINATDGYYDIGGLNPGTTYNVRTALRRRDSGLWSNTDYCYPTTKSISTITGWSQLTLPPPGNDAIINYSVSNPSGNFTHVYLERNNDGGNDYNCNSGNDNVFSGNKTLYLSKSAVNKIYSLHSFVTTPYNGNNNLRGTSGMMITCRTSGDTSYFHCYNVTFIMSKDNCGPTAMKAFTCQEQQPDIATLTGCSTTTTYANGNGLRILSGYSNVLIKTEANPLTTRAGATNGSISIAGGNWINAEIAQQQLIEKANTNSFSVTASDTRGFGYTLNSTGITLLKYNPVVINNFKIDRGNGINTTGYLTLNGTYDTINFGAVTNDVPTIKLQIKTKGTSWTSTKINGAANGTINTSKVNEYVITSLVNRGNGNFSCSNKLLKVSGSSGNNINFALGVDYDARIIIYDQLTRKSTYTNQVITKDTAVSSGKILFSAIKGEGVCFGTFYDSSIGGPLQVNKKEVLGATQISTWNY